MQTCPVTSSHRSHSLPDPLNAWHTQSIDESLAQLESNPQTGLNSEQVRERSQYYGLNELEETAGRSSWAILLDQFTNIMLIMLIVVAIISGVIDLIDWRQGGLEAGQVPFKDTIAILLIVILNGVLGYLQESRAEKALAALKNLASPKVRVLREGRPMEVDSKQLVPGDIMLLEAGVQVSADGRLIEESNLQIRESALTGEANAVNKEAALTLAEDTPLGDRINLVFQGTEVVQGRGTVLVAATGMKTELGRIAEMLQGVESEPTPLQQRMTQLGNVLVSGSLILVVLVVVGGLIQSGGDLGVFQQLVEVSLSMAVAVVPEGLPAVITVTLALGTQRMVRRHALIRKLPAVETLGSVTTICSDKTGTLTQNKMVVQWVITPHHTFQVTGEGYAPNGEFLIAEAGVSAQEYPELQVLLQGCALCNDAVLQYEQDDWLILGDPTEGALITLAGKGGVDKEPLRRQFPRVGEIPFSSERKRMSVICQGSNGSAVTNDGQGTYLMFTKGSPELVLERCHSLQAGDRTEVLTDEQRTDILRHNNQMAGAGLRVLGFAYKPLEAAPDDGVEAHEATEQGLVWLGLVGMLDAPRPEVLDAVRRCRNAGIRAVMITGDHQLTARAIAHALGIPRGDDYRRSSAYGSRDRSCFGYCGST